VQPLRHVRRIYAHNTVELKPHSRSDVAVRSIWSTMPSSAAKRLVEAKEIHPVVHLARTMISNKDSETHVRVQNSSPVTCTVEASGLLAYDVLNSSPVDALWRPVDYWLMMNSWILVIIKKLNNEQRT